MRLTVLPRELAEGEVSLEAQLTSLSRAPLSLMLFLIVSSERSVLSECCRELRERHPNVLELSLDMHRKASKRFVVCCSQSLSIAAASKDMRERDGDQQE